MKNQNLSVFDFDVSSLRSILPKSPLGLVITVAIGLGIGLSYGLIHYYKAIKNYETTNEVLVVGTNFTRAEYERLQIGMQLVEAEAILGRGNEKRRTTTTRVFIWENFEGSKITVTFEGGNLTTKEWE